jgi:MerR family transcriptional regulator, thiopeptide resistance regulator
VAHQEKHPRDNFAVETLSQAEQNGSTPSTKNYKTSELAALSGVSVRTLHYYDEIGLLCPVRSENNYRFYSTKEVDRLQQILLYREIGMELLSIKSILDEPGFNATRALENHLYALQTQKARIDRLIAGVEKTIASKIRRTHMNDSEKFESFKKNLVDKNEHTFGKEARRLYGNDKIDKSNAKVMGMNEKTWQEAEDLATSITEALLEGIKLGNPASEAAQRACDIHRKWLCLYWEKDAYNKEAHKALGEMYVSDERFKAYYDKIAPNAAEFLRDALAIYCAS